jgi:hypothetical protein
MAQPPDPTQSQTFVIRLRRAAKALRGQVVEVGTGAARLFEDLGDAMAFIEARAGGHDPRHPRRSAGLSRKRR